MIQASTKKFGRLGALGLAILALSACEIKQQRDDAAPDQGEVIEAEPVSDATPASILRPDIAQPAQPKAVPLKPIETVVSFARGGSELDASATSVLDALLATPQASAGGAIILKGHSDTGGDSAANLEESQMRAEAVQAYLVEQGVSESRFTIIAFGEQNPVEPNALPDGTPNESGRAANRRVEVRIEAPKPRPRSSNATQQPPDPSG